MTRRDDKPVDIQQEYKTLALALLSTAQLQKVLENPKVSEANKAQVQAELKRRESR